MEPAHSETGDCRVEPPASILVARLSMSHLVPLLEFNLWPFAKEKYKQSTLSLKNRPKRRLISVQTAF